MSEILTISEFKELNFQVSPQMKFRNEIIEVDGIKFRSKKEAKYYGKLKLLVKSGHLTGFKMQVKYKFEMNGIKITSYMADFVEDWNGKIVVTDVKGMRTDLYRIKANMMKAFYGITIKEV